MTHSIRILLRGRFRRLVYEVVERIAENLRENEVHPHSRADYGLKNAPLNPSGSKAYLQVPVNVARINEEVGTRYGDWIILGNLPSAVSYAKYLIGHNQAPIGKVYDVSNLNSRNAGVQS